MHVESSTHSLRRISFDVCETNGYVWQQFSHRSESHESQCKMKDPIICKVVQTAAKKSYLPMEVNVLVGRSVLGVGFDNLMIVRETECGMLNVSLPSRPVCVNCSQFLWVMADFKKNPTTIAADGNHAN